jgi:hypothetical protein
MKSDGASEVENSPEPFALFASYRKSVFCRVPEEPVPHFVPPLRHKL